MTVDTLGRDVELTQIGLFFIVTSGLVALFAAFFVWTRWDSKKTTADENADQSEEEKPVKKPLQPSPFRKEDRKQSKWKLEKQSSYQHEWLLTTLKGHTGRVLDIDFSSNGKSLVSIGDDRSLFSWSTRDFNDREHKVVQGKVDLDSATHVRFSPDSKSVLLSLHVANKLAVYKLVKRETTPVSYKFQQVESVDYPAKHTRDIVSIGIACNGKFVMSADDNQLVIYSLHGDLLKTIEIKLNILYHATVSACGRFVAASGFVPGVFVFEVMFDRQGNFVDAKKAFDLKGHSAGVFSFDFNQDSSRCVTASKDGRWRLFNTDIRYAQGEEAKQIASGEMELLRNSDAESVHVAVSPSGKSFAIGAGRHLQIFSSLDCDKEFKLILDIHNEPLTSVRISPCGRMLGTCGDKQIRVFHNVAEYYSEVVSLEAAVNASREYAQKRRLQEQLQDARKKLSAVLGSK